MPTMELLQLFFQLRIQLLDIDLPMIVRLAVHLGLMERLLQCDFFLTFDYRLNLIFITLHDLKSTSSFLR